VEEVGDPHVKVLYDLYHQYVMDDLDVELLVQNIDKIGHFHMAGYPGRHEPMQDSEINYPVILEAIRRSGYGKSVGMEYIPVHDAKDGLRKLFENYLI
jgi:hydroxypyruvate isomerase